MIKFIKYLSKTNILKYIVFYVLGITSLSCGFDKSNWNVKNNI
jgi:hypothetical protein